MRRFEFVEGSSSKFWEIGLEGSSFTVRWGRIGTTGQTQTKSFATNEAARAEHDKLVAEKLRKGYREVESAQDAPVTPPTPGPATPAKQAQSAEAATDQAGTTPVGATPPQPPESDTVAQLTTVTRSASAEPAASLPSPEEEDGVLWTDALLRRVHPRRGGVATRIVGIHPVGTSWSHVRKAWAERASRIDVAISQQIDGADKLVRLRYRLAAEEPSFGSVDDDSTLVALLAWTPDWQVHPELEYITEVLISTAGFAHAVETQLVALERAAVSNEKTSVRLANHHTPDWRADFHGRGKLRGFPRLRGLLVAAPEADYLAARDAAARLRSSGTDAQRAASAFLFPTEAEWVHSDLKTIGLDKFGACLLACVTDSQVLPSTPVPGNVLLGNPYDREPQDLAVTLIDGCGIGAAPFLSTVEVAYSNAELARARCAVLAALGCDVAFKALLDGIEQKEAQAALAEAAKRQPRRAVRLTAEVALQRGKAGDTARSILTGLVRRFPAIVAEVAGSASTEAVRVLETLRADGAQPSEEAVLDDLPEVLRQPPWRAARKPAGQVILDSVPSVSIPDRMVWAPGEREAWRVQTGFRAVKHDVAEWRAVAAASSPVSVATLAGCPAEHARAIAPRATEQSWYDHAWYPSIAAKHELEAVGFFSRRIATDAARVLPSLVPYSHAAFASVIAAAQGQKSVRQECRAWLLRHPEHATAGLLPIALGKPGRQRKEAESALRFLAANGHEATVLGVAKRAGVGEAMADLLTFNPLHVLPAKVPKLPDFVDPSTLSRPLLASGKALPLSAVEAVLTMLAFSPLDEPYAGIAQVKQACDAASLARLAWDIFQAWIVNGAPAKESWCLAALGHLGNDETARRLAPLIREWPGEAAHQRAVTGLDVLGAIGTDVALMHLNGIALKVKFKGLQARAQEKIEALAEARGLTREELEDRLAPDLGLDEDGSMALDFGPRQFRVGFDEQLRPFVADSSGSRLADLPKPRQSDEAGKAAEATTRWGQLKKDARTSAGLQILRLELAMCGQRRFEAETFLELFVRHPLVFHVVRRLVWAVYDIPGRVLATFRVAEDRSLADIDDNTWTLPPGANVGIPHPLELDSALLGRWSQVLGDYEIVQPFAQLGRPTYVLAVEEREARALDRVKGLKLPTGKVLGLEQRRWRRGAPQDGGVSCWMEKPLPEGRVAILDLDPGLFTGMLSESPEQTLGSCTIGRGHWHEDNARPLGELDPIAFSELVADLERLRS